jgi:hypothetical protein
VHRWAQRHRELLESELDDGEVLVDANRALLVSAGKVDLEGGRGGGVRAVRHRRGQKALAAARTHVQLPARFFVLAVTDRRLIVWRATRAFARPLDVATTIPSATVASLRAGRRFAPDRLHLVLTDGAHLQLRALGRGRLDHLADAFTAARSGQTTSTDSA